jgi:hypothetical protein
LGNSPRDPSSSTDSAQGPTPHFHKCAYVEGSKVEPRMDTHEVSSPPQHSASLRDLRASAVPLAPQHRPSQIARPDPVFSQTRLRVGIGSQIADRRSQIHLPSTLRPSPTSAPLRFLLPAASLLRRPDRQVDEREQGVQDKPQKHHKGPESVEVMVSLPRNHRKNQ